MCAALPEHDSKDEALRSRRKPAFIFRQGGGADGPDEYVLHHGSVTSCELPRPKWTFTAAKIILRVGSSAHVYNTTFRLKGIPVFYLRSGAAGGTSGT